jgi:hypothetical protein
MSTTAADRFRRAVEAHDIDAVLDTFAPDVRLFSPTTLPPIEGRDRLRPVFGVLSQLFEDFEYTRVLRGGPVGGRENGASSHALVFRCRIGQEQIEGVDVLDLDEDDRIATLTVLIRPLAGLQALTNAMAARFARK